MSASHFIRLGRIKGRQGILVALKHNKRTLQNLLLANNHIDPNRRQYNYSLTGTNSPEDIATHAKVQMVKAGIDKPRCNAVMGVEILFSLPINRHEQNTKPFFIDCFEWVKKSFEGELLSFDVHLDEAAPHAHAGILPLINGKMRGSDMIGNEWKLKRIINLFHTEVGTHHGLNRNESKRLSVATRELLEQSVLKNLKADPLLKSRVWALVRDDIHKNPVPYAQLLSIKLPSIASNKSFVDYKRARGRGSFIT